VGIGVPIGGAWGGPGYGYGHGGYGTVGVSIPIGR
jgi:hypothetical protein